MVWPVLTYSKIEPEKVSLLRSFVSVGDHAFTNFFLRTFFTKSVHIDSKQILVKTRKRNLFSFKFENMTLTLKM